MHCLWRDCQRKVDLNKVFRKALLEQNCIFPKKSENHEMSVIGMKDGINQAEEAKDLYTENFRTLIKEMTKTQIQVFLLSKSRTFFFFNWRIIALQCCGSLCHTSTRIHYNYIYSFPLQPPFPTPSCPSRSSQSTKLGSLCYTAASRQLGILHDSVYMSMPLSQLVLPFPSPTVSSISFSTSVSPFLLC